MKTIKPGKLPSEEVMRGTCHHCKAVYEAKKGELKYVADQREGDYYTAQCLTCHDSVSFYKHGKH
jgi:hypothetical protein